MKKTATALLLTMVLASGKILCASAFFNPSLPFKISIALPAASLATADLDARDQFNRRIRTVAAQTNFERFWISALNRALMGSLTPARLAVLALLNSAWDGFAGVLRAISNGARHLISVWFSAKRPELRRVVFSAPIATAVTIILVATTPFNALQALLSSFISSTRLLR